jgi:LPS-assembly lipoprotein
MRFLILACYLLLSSCGFRSLYGEPVALTQSTRQELAAIEILPVANYDGMRFRQDLQQQLGGQQINKNPRYQLNIRLDDNLDYFGIRPDDTSSYGKVRVYAEYTLTDKTTGKVVTTGHARSTGGYTIVRSQYASLYAEEDARRRALRSLADRIALQLAMHFQKKSAVSLPESNK